MQPKVCSLEYTGIIPGSNIGLDSRGSFNFGNADQTVNFAQQHGRLLRGHTLGN